MSLYLIANPHARNDQGRKRLDTLCRQLGHRGIRYDIAVCNGLTHATELSRMANRDGRETIVAVGGDGTINRVLNGFFDAEGNRLSAARMGVVHIGTSPDFCRSYGVPTTVEAAVETLVAGVSRLVAIGRVTWIRQSAQNTPTFFGCCANVGLGAMVARGANGGIRRFAGDFLGTFISLLGALCHFRPHRVSLTLDGERRELEGVCNIAIGKTYYIASGLKVHHTLTPMDQRFYVLCVRHLSLRSFAPALRAIYSGQAIRSNDCVSLTYAEAVQVESRNGAVEVEFDGDPAGYCPCRIDTAHDPLELLAAGDSAGPARGRH